VPIELDNTPLELGLSEYGNNTYPTICIHPRVFFAQSGHAHCKATYVKKEATN
jgi:hypothetical protein